MSTEISIYNPIDQAVAEWLEAKAGKSNSPRTATAYRDTMADFRRVLAAERSIDLLGDPALVALTAEHWAAGSRVGRQVSPATFNVRLAIISSFYEYYAKKAILSGRAVVNPIKAVERHKVQPYARATALDSDQIKKALKSIDRTTKQGQRDYALLLILTTTGRRLSEIAAMKRGDLSFGEQITINFPHCKGGKVMSDRLTMRQSTALVAWLSACYGADLASLPNTAPIWVSLSRGGRTGKSYGQPMGIQAIADVCKKVLGTSKVHALRHTFAVMMDEAGASITEIQNRLGHENAATTSIYMERLHAAANPYASKLDEALGTGD